jgi:exopolyphosphatase/guanosine-5'-triphosphate,3'-diphosphate pyrophosphatase
MLENINQEESRSDRGEDEQRLFSADVPVDKRYQQGGEMDGFACKLVSECKVILVSLGTCGYMRSAHRAKDGSDGFSIWCPLFNASGIYTLSAVDERLSFAGRQFLLYSFQHQICFSGKSLILFSAISVTILTRMSAEKLRVAAIDLGTNSFHMVIVEESEDKGIVEIDRVKDMICIGRGSISSKRLETEAMEAGVSALRNFIVLATQRGVAAQNILAFATSAIREAENRDEFIEMVRSETGLKVRVITGKEEAQFIYYGVRNAVSLREKPDLLFDIGGGSVEFIIADKSEVHLLESRKIGVARMLERFIDTDPVSPYELKLLQQFFASEMYVAAEKARVLGVSRAIASSGTAQNIARMIRSGKDADGADALNQSGFTRQEFDVFYRSVISQDAPARRKLTGLDEKRVDLIVPGLILFDTIFRVFGIREVVISDSALREGMVIHYIASIRGRNGYGHLDIRRQSVMELGYRCNWHKPHSQQVARLSLMLYDQLQPVHGLKGRYRELLEYAALLHNIGEFISIAAHHKHSQYIILNGDLRGFSPTEIEIMGNVARYHRKQPPTEKHPLYAKLKPNHRRAVDVLSGILRIANGLERGHRQNVLSVSARLAVERIVLDALVRYEPDIELWSAVSLKSLLEEVLGKPILIEARVQ